MTNEDSSNPGGDEIFLMAEHVLVFKAFLTKTIVWICMERFSCHKWIRPNHLLSKLAFFLQTMEAGPAVMEVLELPQGQQKHWKSKWDNESAMILSLLAVWQAVKTNDWKAAISDSRWQRRTIMLGSLDVPERKILTTAIICGNKIQHVLRPRHGPTIKLPLPEGRIPCMYNILCVI